MIAVDSSVLVRYLVQDDEAQGQIAAEFLEGQLSDEKRGFISCIVFTELIWVLRRTYRLSSADVGAALAGLLTSRQLHFEHRGLLEAAIIDGPDQLADRVIHEVGRRAGCQETVTFDRRFARRASVRLLGS